MSALQKPRSRPDSGRTRDVLVIGGSAGALDPARALLGTLPHDFAGTILVVMHLPPSAPSAMPQILARSCRLPVRTATHGDTLAPGHVFVAPPGAHLLLFAERLRVVAGPRINGHVPAIDPTMRSAAHWHGAAVMGVVLSGVLDDGSLGLLAIQSRGGLVYVQDPATALYPSMPQNAMKRVTPDGVLDPEGLGAELVLRSRDRLDPAGVAPASGAPDPSDDLAIDEQAAESECESPPNEASGFVCPDCGGALWETTEGRLVWYRCRVGHAYTGDGLTAAQAEVVDEAIWTAYRALVEKAALAERLAQRARSQGLDTVAVSYEMRRDEARGRAEVVRRLLSQPPADTPP